MATTIVRITRHAAEAAQLDELKRIFGVVEVVQVSETLPGDPKAAVARFDEIAADAAVVEAVLPTNLLEAALKFSAFANRGGTLIRAVTNRTIGVDGQASFTFAHYERVVKVEIVTEKL
ncbi:hypothetical protein HGA91_02080 [candidate division WWE3 bacterium]|nr:hypothetical protein [candidate division WWE3 bacterium]